MSTKTHWKKLHNPDYLGAYSLDDGKGSYNDVVLTIKSVRIEKVIGSDGKKESCPVMNFVEEPKPMVLNATNQKTLEKLFKTPYIEDWAGRKVQLGVESVKAFGDVVDALRIRNFIPKTKADKLICADTKKEITSTDKMTAKQIAAATQKKFGRMLSAQRWMELETEKPPEPAKPEPEKSAKIEPKEPSEPEKEVTGESESDFELI